MNRIEKIYDHSPIFIQNMMVSLSGYLRNKNRYGKIYYQHRKFLVEFDKWKIDKKLEFQQNELVKFINYAHNNTIFYKKFYANLDVSNIQTLDDLKKLPILSKELLRQNIMDASSTENKRREEWHTGGTTGKSLVVYGQVDDMMKRMALLDHFKSRVGFEHRKMKRATFNGKHIIPPHQKSSVFWRYNKASKQMIYSSFHLSEKNMSYYVQSLNKYKPDSIDGFFMSICDIANYIERHNITLEFAPIAIFPTSETINDQGRALIERVFKCKVYDQYASSEGAPFVTECKYQSLHIELSSGVFEKIDDKTNEILVTSFTTHGTPLIRYQIGDSMIFEEEDYKCKCGLESPIVKKIEGRNLDYLLTKSGAKINGGNIANLFKNMPNALVRAQTIQKSMDEIEILLEVDKNLYKNEYDQLLVNEFSHKFGKDMRISIKHVDEIPRESSGKFRMIKNNISNNF